MTIEEIRKNKPNGATHYGHWDKKLYYVRDGMVFISNSGEWLEANSIFLRNIKPLN